jgi:hypothetical protein
MGAGVGGNAMKVINFYKKVFCQIKEQQSKQ